VIILYRQITYAFPYHFPPQLLLDTKLVLVVLNSWKLNSSWGVTALTVKMPQAMTKHLYLIPGNENRVVIAVLVYRTRKFYNKGNKVVVFMPNLDQL